MSESEAPRSGRPGEWGEAMRELDSVIRRLTPRVATVILLHFAEVARQYERGAGSPLSAADRRSIQAILVGILAREARP